MLCGFFPFGFQWWGQFFGRIWKCFGNVYMILLYFHNKVTTRECYFLLHCDIITLSMVVEELIMKYKIYIWMATLLIVTCVAAAAEESSSALTVQNNVSPLVYTEGCIPSGIGGFEIGMVDGAKVQQIALIGAGTNARLSWSAYMQDGGFVIDLQLDAVVAPGTEEYTLSLLVDGVSYAEPFAITVVEGAPPQEGLVADVPSVMGIGQRLSVPPAVQYTNDALLPEGTRSEFSLEGACFAQTGEAEYTAVSEGTAQWSLSLTSGNYAFAPLTGSITVSGTAPAAQQESTAQAGSVVQDIDLSGLDRTVSAGEEGYVSLGNVTVTAEVGGEDVLTADVAGGSEIVDLYLSEPEINGNQYSFELLAGNAQTEGTSECVFTARAGESTQSEAFTIRVESAQETQP